MGGTRHVGCVCVWGVFLISSKEYIFWSIYLMLPYFLRTAVPLLFKSWMLLFRVHIQIDTILSMSTPPRSEGICSLEMHHQVRAHWFGTGPLLLNLLCHSVSIFRVLFGDCMANTMATSTTADADILHWTGHPVQRVSAKKKVLEPIPAAFVQQAPWTGCQAIASHT